MPGFKIPPLRPPTGILPVLLIVAGGGLVVLGLFYSSQRQQLGQLRQQLFSTQQQVSELEAKKNALAQELSELQKERGSLSERIDTMRTQLSSSNTELEEVRSSLQSIQVRYDQLNTERDRLKAQLATTTSERDEYRQQVQHLEEEKSEVQRALKRWRERLALLDRDYRKVTEELAQLKAAPKQTEPPPVNVVGVIPQPPAPKLPPSGIPSPSVTSSASGMVELPPIVVRKDQAATVSGIRGRVLEVNEVQNFVVVDRGSTDGVSVGMSFDFLRGSEVVGRATVIRVRPRLSACDIIGSATVGPILPGDTVVQSW
ncbi:MAG: hypothetical protein HYT88_05895 [Candidatus Omnitrophica bacterium]|nr:hypothetical protein [Candidatus Omnitrophota bacterium]MBI2173909.1 hypothetical protein [Candidatus Omnitrophota bacterium]MBI3010615.1 hypothetical protein [Candidatus Omnitrophota bacterium]